MNLYPVHRVPWGNQAWPASVLYSQSSSPAEGKPVLGRVNDSGIAQRQKNAQRPLTLQGI